MIVTASNYKSIIVVTVSLVFSVLAAILISLKGYSIAFLLIGLCVAIPVMYICLTNVAWGIIITFFLSFTLAFVNRVFQLYQYPLGLVYDGLILLMYLGVIYRLRDTDQANRPTLNAIGVLLIIWAVLNVFQVLNPSAPSVMGWIMAVKSNLYPVFYFFLFYFAFTSFDQVKLLIKIWFVLVFLAALYSFKQRYIGLADYESFVYTNALKSSLYITWGKLRVFSFLNDPMSYAMVLLYTLILSFGMFFLSMSHAKKILLFVFFMVVLWSLLLTGTRTAYFLLPVGLIVFGLITLNWRILLIVFFGLIIGAGVIFTSSNPQFHIFKTAFRGSEDASMNVRLQNQRFIRPYIFQKPQGWGLASTGGFGRMYNGGTVIGNFPPDSEYVRIAIENGWIGLLAWLIIQFLIFRSALLDFFTVSDKQFKIYFATFLTLFYVIIIAQYPQEALRVPPTGIIVAFVLAMLARLKDLSISYRIINP